MKRQSDAQPGIVVGINIVALGGQLPQPVQQVRALPGRGLEGDRYNLGTGSFQKPNEKLIPGQEASLIEIEAIEGLQRECGISITPAQSRRNICTRGIALNDLVGHEFTVGSVRMKGIKLCRPCDHLESLTHKGTKAGLHNRGGLRAQILNEGVICVGDAVTPAETANEVRSESPACA
jgi:hypothetical protein